MYRYGREIFLFPAHSPRDSECLLVGNLDGLEQHAQNHSVLAGEMIAE